MASSCQRQTYVAGEHIFRQGDPPSDLYLVVEGQVDIVKELVLLCKNRWPVGVNQWEERTKRINKPILLKSLKTAEFFGELAIIQNQPRSSSAIAANRCVLLKVDRLEFLHLISYGNSGIDGRLGIEEDAKFKNIVNKYINDQDILSSMGHVVGGPTSEAYIGGAGEGGSGRGVSSARMGVWAGGAGTGGGNDVWAGGAGGLGTHIMKKDLLHQEDPQRSAPPIVYRGGRGGARAKPRARPPKAQ
ncbi:cyclic nucleotide-binding-like protein [Ochromonadaceae sp. CCMP2298]|nr:cyclic nucleotide-binding-like protein [Ochromonadaceae sp. CCMP2298]